MQNGILDQALATLIPEKKAAEAEAINVLTEQMQGPQPADPATIPPEVQSQIETQAKQMLLSSVIQETYARLSAQAGGIPAEDIK